MSRITFFFVSQTNAPIHTRTCRNFFFAFLFCINSTSTAAVVVLLVHVCVCVCLFDIMCHKSDKQKKKITQYVRILYVYMFMCWTLFSSTDKLYQRHTIARRYFHTYRMNYRNHVWSLIWRCIYVLDIFKSNCLMHHHSDRNRFNSGSKFNFCHCRTCWHNGQTRKNACRFSAGKVIPTSQSKNKNKMSTVYSFKHIDYSIAMFDSSFTKDLVTQTLLCGLKIFSTSA